MAMVDVLVAQAGGVDDRLAGMSFRAVFAGWLVATGVAVLLYVGGLAMGFSAFNAWNVSASAKGIGIGTSIWIVLTWIVSLWLGGMFASWSAAHNDRTIGSLHGVTVWGLSVTVAFFWVVPCTGTLAPCIRTWGLRREQACRQALHRVKRVHRLGWAMDHLLSCRLMFKAV
jgi:hypothetical protein